MTLIVPNKLRALVESYVMKPNRSLEKGGYLVGRDNVVTAFVPVPNSSSSSHSNTYLIDPGWRPLADEFAKMLNSQVLGDLHTHPNGTVPSEQDGRYVRGMPWPYHIILSDKGESFDWYCVDSSLRGVSLVESDAQLEGMMELMAGELNMADLGRFFITPGGEILSTKKEGMRYVVLDQDVLRVERWWEAIQARQDAWRIRKTLSRCAKDTGMSMARVKAAFKKLDWQA